MKTLRDRMIEFLETYKCLPCLWDLTDKMYTDKHAREQAYEILVDKFRLIEGENATIDSMKRKIDNMRSTYRREFKKVQERRIQGGEEYIPRLWYYELLSFLNENNDGSVQSQPGLKKGSTSSNHSFVDDEDYQLDHSSQTYDDEEPKAKKVKIDTVYFKEQQEDHDEDALQGIQEVYAIKEVSEPEAFAKAVGLQLKEITPAQRTIAERLISEIIFYGRLNKLNLDTTVFLNEDFR